MSRSDSRRPIHVGELEPVKSEIVAKITKERGSLTQLIGGGILLGTVLLIGLHYILVGPPPVREQIPGLRAGRL